MWRRKNKLKRTGKFTVKREFPVVQVWLCTFMCFDAHTSVSPWCQHVYLWGINLGFNRGSFNPRWTQATNATPSVTEDTFQDKSRIKWCRFHDKRRSASLWREPIRLIIALSCPFPCVLWCIYERVHMLVPHAVHNSSHIISLQTFSSPVRTKEMSPFRLVHKSSCLCKSRSERTKFFLENHDV